MVTIFLFENRRCFYFRHCSYFRHRSTGSQNWNDRSFPWRSSLNSALWMKNVCHYFLCTMNLCSWMTNLSSRVAWNSTFASKAGAGTVRSALFVSASGLPWAVWKTLIRPFLRSSPKKRTSELDGLQVEMYFSPHRPCATFQFHPDVPGVSSCHRLVHPWQYAWNHPRPRSWVHNHRHEKPLFG
jgi:hypothetical protein